MIEQKIIPFTEEELRTEVWMDIKYFSGLYQVSNLGRVKSLERRVPTFRGTRRVRERILKISSIKNGYPLINVTINNKSRHILLYKAVITSFVPKTNKNLVCRHLDGNKFNSRLINLKWGTAKENSHDTLLHWRMNTKLSEQDVKEIMFLSRNNFLNKRKLSRIFPTSMCGVNDIKNGNSFTHVDNTIISMNQIRKSTIEKIENLVRKDLYRGIIYRDDRKYYVVSCASHINNKYTKHAIKTFEEAVKIRNYFYKELYGNKSYFYIKLSEEPLCSL